MYKLIYAECLWTVDFLSQAENQRYCEIVGLQHHRKDSFQPLGILCFPRALWLKSDGCWTTGWYSSKQNSTGGIMKLCWIIHWVLNDAGRVFTVNSPEGESSARQNPVLCTWPVFSGRHLQKFMSLHKQTGTTMFGICQPNSSWNLWLILE